MLTPYDVATHWPLLESHLLVRRRLDDDQTPLHFLAELQAWNGGEPAAFRSRFLAAGHTEGEAGNAWRALVAAERAGVVRRYRGVGRRPSLWTFTGTVDRWGVPWIYSAREVATVVENCICRAELSFVARSQGPGNVSARVNPKFHVAPELHLGQWAVARATTPERRALGTRFPLQSVTPPRDDGGSPGTSIPSLSGRSDDFVVVHPDDDDGKVATLQQAIAEATGGGSVYGAPLARLRAVADLCDDELAERLAFELRHRAGTRSPVVLVDLAEALRPIVAGEAHRVGAAARDHDAARLAFLEAHDAGDEPEALELRGRLGSVGGDAS